MTSNPEQIVQQLEQDFQDLMIYVTNSEKRTAYTVERQLFSQLLALGKQLLLLFFVSRARLRPADPQTKDGLKMNYHDRRPRSYYSVFGKLSFTRHYFVLEGESGVCPVDAELQLPVSCYSDLLREWAVYGAVESSYQASSNSLERILGISLSCQALERMMSEDSTDVEAFYEDAPSTTNEEASLLVVQADGKGIPMVTAKQEQAVRLSKGQKRSAKKEAIVTALYSIAPYPRSPEEVVAALLHDNEETTTLKTPRPRPVAKELRGSLAGKKKAIKVLAQRTALRDTNHIQARVALSDGADALQQQLLAQFPDYTLILDIIHASEYLWKSANALLGETHSERTDWVREHLTDLLAGKTTQVIASLKEHLQRPDLSQAQCKIVNTTIAYYQRNSPFMRYDHYLEQGFPIGTGVVEAACGHLVKDRLDCSGMRWKVPGAQAVMDLRAVRLSEHWDSYWLFHRQQASQRLYGNTTLPISESLDTQFFPLAA
jgi:hypothetical protein